MSQINDGGPAFPRRLNDNPEDDETRGMALRDYFAGQAMQALAHDILIEQHWEDVLLKQGLTVDEFPRYLAHLAYLEADAMLGARGQAVMTDTVTLPRAVVELCVQAARGMVNAAEQIVPDTVGRALDQSYTVRQFKELESVLLAALETHHA